MILFYDGEEEAPSWSVLQQHNEFSVYKIQKQRPKCTAASTEDGQQQQSEVKMDRLDGYYHQQRQRLEGIAGRSSLAHKSSLAMIAHIIHN
jgi:hypothetical protein